MGPLSGIRVLDLTRVVAGPICTRILADQGADVIKIEPPEGDLSRTFPPIDDQHMTPYFAQQNAGKRFCSLDLRAPGATDLVLDLVEQCDVLVENFRPGVMAKFGLGPDELCTRFPKLVYCSITGFGQDGPWAQRRAYAPMGHLESGLLAHDRHKIGRPVKQPAIVLGDVASGMMAASGVNAMLVQAARTGIGGQLDVSMVESLVYIQEWVSTELAGGWDGTNNGACEETSVLSLPDGQIWGMAGNLVAWFDHLIVAMDRPDLAEDPRFADPVVCEANKAALEDIVTDWAAGFESFDAFCANLESRSPFTTAELRSINELVETDWATHRGLITDTELGIRLPSRPITGQDIGTNGHLASRGADNRSMLSDVLNLSDSEIDHLTEAGILQRH